jgi:tetratricopeptide (TPR) repeat protein
VQGETDQRQLARAIIGWLERCAQPWLLIFDNAEDLSLLPAHLPRRGNGSILLTTRANAVGSLGSSLEVETMGILEGTQLLLRRAQRLATASEEEIDEATNIVVALAQIPLMLDQAGAYIEETRCSFSTYLQLYQDHRTVLLAKRGMQISNYPDSVATTWSRSFQHIEQTNSAAAQLLSLCAFLTPDHIPEELLTEGAAYWPTQLQQAVADRCTFNQLLETLLAFSLVKRLPEDHLLSIHRLVQAVQIERMDPQEQRQWAERLVRAVYAVFPHDPEDKVASWPQCQRYLDQAQACDLQIQQHQFLFPEAADLLDWTGTYLRARARYTLAEPLLRQALHIREQRLGPEHPDVATSLNNLGKLYHFQGKYEEAELLYRRALRIHELQLGEMHAKTADVLYDFAGLQQARCHSSEAACLYRRVLTIREHMFGPDHLLTIETRERLRAISVELDQGLHLAQQNGSKQVV